MIRQKDRENTLILMDQNIREAGKMIYNMVTEFKNGRKVAVTKDNIFKEKNMEKANINGQMVLNILVIGYKII